MGDKNILPFCELVFHRLLFLQLQRHFLISASLTCQLLVLILGKPESYSGIHFLQFYHVGCCLCFPLWFHCLRFHAQVFNPASFSTSLVSLCVSFQPPKNQGWKHQGSYQTLRKEPELLDFWNTNLFSPIEKHLARRYTPQAQVGMLMNEHRKAAF